MNAMKNVHDYTFFYFINNTRLQADIKKFLICLCPTIALILNKTHCVNVTV